MPTDQVVEAGREDIEVKSKSCTADVMQPIQQVREVNPAANTGLWIIQDFIKLHIVFNTRFILLIHVIPTLPY